MKLTLLTFVALVLTGTAVLATSALAATPKSPTLTIRHQMKGCHSWSLDGKTWQARQTLVVSHGSTLTVVNKDVMPHTMIQVKGPKASVTRAAMRRIGAAARVVFSAKGTYVFITKAGEDYTTGVKTVGEDNALRLVVKVT